MNASKICGIYRIISPTSRVYIGQSKDCLQRQRSYRKGAGVKQVKLYRSIAKHGWAAHAFTVIAECDPVFLDVLEERFILLYNTTHPFHGLNLRLGGSRSSFSAEARARMSKSARIKVFTPEHREAMRLAQLGRKHPEEVKRKISDGQRGEKGNQWGKGNPVLQFTLDGVFMARHTSAHAVQRQTGIPCQNIQDCCRYNAGLRPFGNRHKNTLLRKPVGQHKAGGFIWKYE